MFFTFPEVARWNAERQGSNDSTVALYGFKSPWRGRSPGSLELIAAAN